MKWELDSLNFYHSGHPLSNISYPFETTRIEDLKENDFDGYWQIKGVAVPKINLKTIVGTVLVKNKKNNIIVLSCPDGVIKVKCYKVQFAKYDKVIEESDEHEEQDSFFEKGTNLSVTGFLRDGVFIPKVYKKNNVDPIMKVVISNNNFDHLEAKR